MRCADCGAEVEQVPRTVGTEEPRWGRRTDPRPGLTKGKGWDMCCRWEPGDKPHTVKSADYHYVEGETQRHFVANDPD